MKDIEIVPARYKNGKPVWFKANIKDHSEFSSYLFETEEIATLAAIFYKEAGYNTTHWLPFFKVTLKVWDIKSSWS